MAKGKKAGKRRLKVRKDRALKKRSLTAAQLRQILDGGERLDDLAWSEGMSVHELRKKLM